MKTVSLSEAKANLSKLVRYVASGEVVLILSHGRPVARLSAASPAASPTDEAWLAALERDGIVKRGRRPPSLDFLKMPTPTLPEEHSLLRALLEEREEGP